MAWEGCKENGLASTDKLETGIREQQAGICALRSPDGLDAVANLKSVVWGVGNAH